MRAPWLSTSAEKLLWKLPSSRRAQASLALTWTVSEPPSPSSSIGTETFADWFAEL
jgi:hypothetical protein